MKSDKKHTKTESQTYIPIEILKKLKNFTHLRRREVKRFRKWAFFDL
jgi:hypothetical protein